MANGWHACVLKIDPITIGDHVFAHGPYCFQRFFKDGFAYLGDPDDVITRCLLDGDGYNTNLQTVGPVSQYANSYPVDADVEHWPTVLDFLTADAYRNCLHFTDVRLFTEIGSAQDKPWAECLPECVLKYWQSLSVEQRLALYARADLVRQQDDLDR